LATLAAAQEMASLETLARWTGLEADYRLKQLLWEEWAPFLFRSDDRFRLYHASLRDFLSGEMTVEDLIPADKALVTEMAERTRGSHRRIATCYLTDSTRWADHNGYALRHLAQAGMFAELGNLIENRAWYEAQRNYDPSLDAYAADVVQSLALAERRGMDGLPQVVAWSLLYATVRMRSIVLEQIAESLAQLGDLERALNITESIRDEPFYGRALTTVSWTYAQRGELEEALAVAQRIRDEEARANALRGVALDLVDDVAQTGDRQAARCVQEAFAMVRAQSRDEVLLNIDAFAPALAKLGVINATWDRIQALEALLYAEISAGEDKAQSLSPSS
jgi:tetratricopeptide (TPR) repeat protein